MNEHCEPNSLLDGFEGNGHDRFYTCSQISPGRRSIGFWHKDYRRTMELKGNFREQRFFLLNRLKKHPNTR